MIDRTELIEYECNSCGLKQIAEKELEPVLLIDVYSNPVKCKCGSTDFIAHIERIIRLSKPIDCIRIDIPIKKLKG